MEKNLEEVLENLKENQEVVAVFSDMGLSINEKIESQRFTNYFLLTYMYANDDLKRKFMTALGEDLITSMKFLLASLINTSEEDTLIKKLEGGYSIIDLPEKQSIIVELLNLINHNTDYTKISEILDSVSNLEHYQNNHDEELDELLRVESLIVDKVCHYIETKNPHPIKAWSELVAKINSIISDNYKEY